MHGGLLSLLHQDHLPVLGNVVFNGGHSPGVVDNHDGYAGKQQRFNENAHALLRLVGNLLHVIHQGVHRIGNHFHAHGAAGLPIDDLTQLPVRLGNILAQHIAHAAGDEAHGGGGQHIQVTDDNLRAHGGALNLQPRCSSGATAEA